MVSVLKSHGRLMEDLNVGVARWDCTFKEIPLAHLWRSSWREGMRENSRHNRFEIMTGIPVRENGGLGLMLQWRWTEVNGFKLYSGC